MASTLRPNRFVLEGVPYVGYDMQRTGGVIEDTPVCAAMRSALAFLGDPCSYPFLMGVSGAAFRLGWNAEYLDGGNLSTFHMGADPLEHVRRTFGAVGWAPRIVMNRLWRQPVDESQPVPNIFSPDFVGDQIQYQAEAFFRDWIAEELQSKGYPMLAIGVMMPPEFNILAGYDQGGDLLIGWSSSQDWPENRTNEKVSFEPSGYFRKRDWFKDMPGLVSFDYKTGKPTLQDTYRNAVEWAVKLARTSRFKHFYSGLAAYTAWAEMLKEDEVFSAADSSTLGWRLMVHNDALAAPWEGRMHAVEFLREGARLLPHWSAPYEEAAHCYAAEVGTFEKIADVLGGFGPGAEKAEKLAQAENRAAIISLVYEARALDEKAIERLEKTLVDGKDYSRT